MIENIRKSGQIEVFNAVKSFMGKSGTKSSHQPKMKRRWALSTPLFNWPNCANKPAPVAVNPDAENDKLKEVAENRLL